MNISELVTYSTVMIECIYRNGKQGRGTGFILETCKDGKNNYVPILVTNKHVVKDAAVISATFCLTKEYGTPDDLNQHKICFPVEEWINYSSDDVDLCFICIGKFINEWRNKGKTIFFVPVPITLIPEEKSLSELSAIEEVTMIGYPIGLCDYYNNKPIIRRGITATHIKKNYQGKKEFLVDMACFPGSSGSPVFILNEGSYTKGNDLIVGDRILLVGILRAGPTYNAAGQIIDTDQAAFVNTGIPTNLGVCIKSSYLLDFEIYIKEKGMNK